MSNTQTTATGGLAPGLQTYYDKKLVERLLSNHVHAQFGEKRPIPKKNGKTINFRKFSSLSQTPGVLTEGVTPAGDSLSETQVTASILQYGNYIELSDLIDLVSIDPVLDQATEILGEQAADWVDVITRDVIAAGTNVQYANGRASRVTVATGDNLTVLEIRKAIRTMKRNKVKPMSDGSYVCIVEPGTTFDLQSDTNWINAQQYAGSTAIFNGEIGKLYGVRFVETPLAKKFAGAGAASVDVYCSLLIGRNAYSMVDVASSGAIENLIKPLGSGGANDPLNQRQTTGFKVSFTAMIMEQLAILRIEHTVSA